MRTADLDYELPPELIATTPAEPRDSARLMVCDRETGRVSHHHVRDLPTLGLFTPGDLIVVNQTRVLPAFLQGQRVATGGHVTGLFLAASPVKSSDEHPGIRWRVLLESRGKLLAGETISLHEVNAPTPRVRLTLEESLGRGEWWCDVDVLDLRLDACDTASLLNLVGQTPLPPYIRKARKQRGEVSAEAFDAERYNTVFADNASTRRDAGSVAAPTAGLHFTPALLAQLESLGVHRAAVTLHVGQGTFLPVQTDTLEEHPIHAEFIDVTPSTLRALADCRERGGRVLAVGTTTVRTLESLPPVASLRDPGHAEGFKPYHGDTRLFITPASHHRFQFTDRLLTNFHLPRSTLLALVAALPGVGLDRLLGWYAVAIAERYRFYSFGDAMLIV